MINTNTMIVTTRALFIAVTSFRECVCVLKASSGGSNEDNEKDRLHAIQPMANRSAIIKQRMMPLRQFMVHEVARDWAVVGSRILKFHNKVNRRIFLLLSASNEDQRNARSVLG